METAREGRPGDGVADAASVLEETRSAVTAARATRRCLDFALGEDLPDSERVNVFERWTDVEALEAFRGTGPSTAQRDAILGAEVRQYEVPDSTSPT